MSGFARLFGAGVLVSGAHSLILAVLPLYLNGAGAPATMIGLVVGAYAVAQVAFRLLGAWTVDRFPQRIMLAVGASLLAVAFVGYALFPVGYGLVAPRLAHGLGLAAFYTTAYAWLSLSSSPAERGRYFGIYGAGTGISLALMPIAGIAIYERWGVGALFPAGAIAAGLAIFLTVPSVAPRTRGAGLRSPTKLVRPFLSPLASLLLACMSLGMLEAFMPLLAKAGQVAYLQLVFAGFGLGIGLGRIFGGTASDRFGRRPVASSGLAASAVALGVLTVASGDLQFCLVAIVYGGGFGMATTCLFTDVSDRSRAEEVGQTLGLASLVQDAGIAGGAAVAGVFAASSLESLAPLGALLLAVSFAVTASTLGSRGRARRDDGGASNPSASA